MSKCPNCEKEINQLKFEKDVRQRGVVKIDKDGDLEYLIDQPDEELIIADYFCPLCNEGIDVEDPEDFLKGKENDNKS